MRASRKLHFVRRTVNQADGDHGEDFVKALVSASGHWIPRTQERDYGVDLEIELASPDPSGCFVKLQVKAHRSPRGYGGSLRESLPTKTLRYADQCRVPFVLVVVDLSARRAYYVWLQEWIEARKGLIPTGREATVEVPLLALEDGLRGRLKDVAQGNTDLHLTLAARETLRCAISRKDNGMIKRLMTALAERDPRGASLVPGMIEWMVNAVDPATGVRRQHTDPGMYELELALRHLAGQHGECFTREQVVRLVSYSTIEGVGMISRSGVRIVGTLFDCWPSHMAALKVSSSLAFEPCLHFWASAREANPDLCGEALVYSDRVLLFHGVELAGENRRDARDKWINRGEIVYIHYAEFA